MSDTLENKTYTCVTQEGYDPTLAAAPASHSDPSLPSIVLGFSSVIPRWNTSSSNPTTLKWFVRAETFPSADLARDASEAFEQATKEWNDVAFGVTVSQTTDKKAANFNLVYRVNPPKWPGALAYAFFPNEADRDVIIFQYSLTAAKKGILKNFLMHELGHIFGLRHEFAIAKEGKGAKQFMQTNPLSVMEYNPVSMIQETDKEGTRQFYKLKNGADIDGSPVTDYMPQLRRTNQRSP